jgi:hypothetical protein
VLYPDDRATVFEGWEAAARQGASWEYRVITPRGEVRFGSRGGRPGFIPPRATAGFEAARVVALADGSKQRMDSIRQDISGMAEMEQSTPGKTLAGRAVESEDQPGGSAWECPPCPSYS